MRVSVRIDDEDIMPWEVWNDEDDKFNASLEFSYEEQGQDEEGANEPDLLNIRPRTEQILAEVESEWEYECDEEGLSAADKEWQ